MQAMRRVKITGTGMSVPPRVVTNKDLEGRMDTTDEWIQQRTGVLERRWVDKGMGPADLAEAASRAALDAAGVSADQIDYILVASLSPHHQFPGTSAFLQDRLGISGCGALDLRAQCTGFLYGLQMGHLLVASGQYERVLLVGAEVQSTGLDVTTRGRDLAVIFGDGAGAILLEPSEADERGILSVHTHAEGKHAKRLWTEAPGSVYQPRITQEMIDQGRHFPYMDGRFVFKHAVTRMPEVVREALDHNGCGIEDVDLMLFHQANLRINEAVGRGLGLAPEKTCNNIQKYGNCSAASLPILLDECVRAGRLVPGSLLGMAGFGSGFTWGAALIRW